MSNSWAKPKAPMIKPIPPIKLITPLALLLNGEGIRSGIREITGVRKTAIASRTTAAAIINNEKAPVLLVIVPLYSGLINPTAIGIKMNANAARGAAVRING